MNLSIPTDNAKTMTNGVANSIGDAKQQISEHVEQLAQVATDASRDVAAQAAQAGQDVGPKAAAIVSELPSLFQRLRIQAMSGADRLGQEARSVRVIRVDPDASTPTITRNQSGAMTGVALLGGLSAGLALMYFLDPVEGARRRQLMRAQLRSWTSVGRQKVSALAEQTKTAVAAQTNKAGSQLDELAGEESFIPEPETAAQSDLQPVGPGGEQGSDDGFNAYSTEPVDEQVPSEIR